MSGDLGPQIVTCVAATLTPGFSYTAQQASGGAHHSSTCRRDRTSPAASWHPAHMCGLYLYTEPQKTHTHTARKDTQDTMPCTALHLVVDAKRCKRACPHIYRLLKGVVRVQLLHIRRNATPLLDLDEQTLQTKFSSAVSCFIVYTTVPTFSTSPASAWDRL